MTQTCEATPTRRASSWVRTATSSALPCRLLLRGGTRLGGPGGAVSGSFGGGELRDRDQQVIKQRDEKGDEGQQKTVLARAPGRGLPRRDGNSRRQHRLLQGGGHHRPPYL